MAEPSISQASRAITSRAVAATVGSAARSPAISARTSSSASAARSPGTVRRSITARAEPASANGAEPPETTVAVSEP